MRNFTAFVAGSLALAGPMIAANNFKLGVLPDTQVYSDLYPDTFRAQTRWLADNFASMNMPFTTHVGDIVEGPFAADQWQVADEAMGYLDAVGHNYAVVPGNHDVTSNLNQHQPYFDYFGPSRFESMPTYRGHSPSGYSQYHVFEGGGREFLSLSLDINAPDVELNWAQSVLDANPTMPTILTTHILLQTDGALYPTVGWDRVGYGNSPVQVWDKLIAPNEQIFLTINGHFHGAAYSSAFNEAGLEVHRVLVDYQGAPDGGGGYLRWMEFDFENNQIINKTYSPLSDDFRDQFEYDDFSISVDLEKRFALVVEQPTPGSLLKPEVEAVSSEESRFGGRLAVQAANGSGIMGYKGQTEVMLDSVHAPDDAADDMWSTERNVTEDQYIVFDLGRGFNIDGIAIWQFGEDPESGVAEFDLFFSTAAEFFEADLEWIGTFDLTAWDGESDILAQAFDFDETLLGARFFKLAINATHGDDRFTGLSEVRFIAGIPEPSALTLLGLGGMALLLVHRRRR